MQGSFSEIPKRARESHPGQKRLGLFECMPAPLGFQLILVPTVGQLPALFRRQCGAALEVVALAPASDVLFGPEEQHCASGETDVVPPMVRGNGKVNESLAPAQLPGLDL